VSVADDGVGALARLGSRLSLLCQLNRTAPLLTSYTRTPQGRVPLPASDSVPRANRSDVRRAYGCRILVKYPRLSRSNLLS
jgi:hypothetical protein